MADIVSIDKLRRDTGNRFRGTGRGRRAVKESLENYGVGRSLVLDVHGNVVCGNTTLMAALESGIDDVVVVSTHGEKLIAHKRLDLDLTEKHGKARGLSAADNLSAHWGFSPDLTALAEDLRSGLELPDSILTADEVSAMLAKSVEQAAALAGELERGETFGGGIPAAEGANESPAAEPQGRGVICPACGHCFS